MTKSYLPPELVEEEILSRVPATSLKRLRSTCKRWKTLFKKPRFTQRHFHKAPKESMVVMFKEQRFYPVSVNLNVNVAPPSIEFQGALLVGPKDSDSNLGQQVKIIEVFHCDGLLLCTTCVDNRFMVWNPLLGETRWMRRKTGNEKYARFALGYENNKSSRRSYKILRCWGLDFGDKLNDERPVGYEIYDFSCDSWKVLDDVADGRFPTANGVSLKGNTYWINPDKNPDTGFLLVFDFTTKRFKNHCLPGSQNHRQRALSLVGEEQLLLVQQFEESSKLDIYVTKKVDSEAAGLLWSKSFTVDLPTDANYCSSVFSILLIDEEKKVALCCNAAIETGRNIVYTIGEDKAYDSELIPYLESTNKPWWLDGLYRESSNKPLWFPSIFYYVPSLVQI